jgi:hypothetical protein
MGQFLILKFVGSCHDCLLEGCNFVLEIMIRILSGLGTAT